MTVAVTTVQRTCEHCGIPFSIRPANVVNGRGQFCSKPCHYAAARHTLGDHLWPFVDTSAGPDGCWPWTGGLDTYGYGKASYPGGRTVGAHRLSWEIHNGPVPKGFHVLHNCPGGDNRACTNAPGGHLWLGTNKQNVADMVAKGRQTRGIQCHSAKLTEGQVIALRADHATRDISQQALAAQYGVSPRAVSKIIKGESWKHVITEPSIR